MSAGEPAPLAWAGLKLDRPRIMGVVNVTPDSFSDGGETPTTAAAVARGREMLEAGAAIIDVGGESTRPGAAPLPIDEELGRVVPVVAALAGGGALVSIDTRHAAVMRAAIDAGARIVNDVSALAGDAASMAVAAASGVSVVLMHMQGEPRTMQQAPHYDDAPTEVAAWLAQRLAACEAAGMTRQRIAVDHGIGFGKTVEHNLRILARLEALRGLGAALVVGVSRKSFIARVDRDGAARERLGGSLAAALWAVLHGADIVRVHDVAATRQALAVWAAIDRCSKPPPG